MNYPVFRVAGGTLADHPPFIQRLDHNPGLLSERIAPLATSSADWKIVQEVDLEPYFLTSDKLTNTWRELSGLCASVLIGCRYQNILNDAFKQIQDTLKQTERIVDLISEQKMLRGTRTRRSILPVIGKISRFLFGTLDENAEKEIKYLIEITANDTRQTAKLLANLTELTQTEFDNTNNRISNLEMVIKNISESQDYLMQVNMISSAVELLNEGVLQYKLETEIITDMILFASQGTIHPRFIPPNLIQKSAVLVKETVLDAIFPGSGSANSILKIAKISKLSIFFSKFKIIYYLAIPLLDLQSYLLYRASAVPIRQNKMNTTNTFAYIWPLFRDQ